MKSIVLITDFGIGSPYVAEMKGAILSVNCQARIVDGTHAVPPQDVMHGAMVFRQLRNAFPLGTVFVGVVDPGVGTRRDILLAERNGCWFIGPDNGLLSLVVDVAASVLVLDQPQFWRSPVSATFHGRDIMGPVAAALSAGMAPTRVASPMEHPMVRLRWPIPLVEVEQIVGELVYIDSFGNLISNIHSSDLGVGDGYVDFASQTLPIRSTYGEQENGRAVALIGSSGWVEVAVVNGNAKKQFGAEVGDAIVYRKPVSDDT